MVKTAGAHLHIPTILFFFFFNDTATTEIYTLSLHDALPIGSRTPDSSAANPPTPTDAASTPSSRRKETRCCAECGRSTPGRSARHSSRRSATRKPHSSPPPSAASTNPASMQDPRDPHNRNYEPRRVQKVGGWTGTRRAVNMSGVRGPVLVGEVLVDELDGSGVVAAVAAELAAKRVVELVDVDAVEPAVVGDVPLEFTRHLLHVSERASTARLTLRRGTHGSARRAGLGNGHQEHVQRSQRRRNGPAVRARAPGVAGVRCSAERKPEGHARDGVGRRSGGGRGSRLERSLPTAPRRRSHWAPAPAS